MGWEECDEISDHSWLHSTHRFILRIVRYIRRTVEKIVDTVASVGSHHSTTIRTGDGFAREHLVPMGLAN
jgi:hypothetical protein